MLTLVRLQLVVFLCVSRTLFRMSLVMVVLESCAQHTTRNHNQARSKERTTHTQKHDMLQPHQS